MAKTTVTTTANKLTDKVETPEPKRSTKKEDAPVLRLEGRDAVLAENFCGVKAMQDEVKTDLGELEGALKDVLLTKFLELCRSAKRRVPNPQFTTGGSNGNFQIKTPIKVVAQENEDGQPMDPLNSLVKLGIDKKKAKELAELVEVKTETSLNWDKLVDDEPILAEKVAKALAKALTEDEYDKVFVKTAVEKVDERALFAKLIGMFDNIDTIKLLLTEWAKPSLAMGQLQFRRGMNGVYRVMANHRERMGNVSFIHSLPMGVQAEAASGTMGDPVRINDLPETPPT